MASIVLGFVSGGNNILSGNFYSGLGAFHPVGGVQLRADKSNSGNIYVALSGNLTIQSGAMGATGIASGGLMDGFQLGAGDAYFIPKLGFTLSGTPSIFVNPDAVCSGVARLYIETY